MFPWQKHLDFGVVHPLIYLACRTGEGPVIETLQKIADDPTFGAVEIAPPKDPAVRKQARELLAASKLRVVYLPVLPILLEDIGIGAADPDRRRAAMDRLIPLLDEAIEFEAPLAMLMAPRDVPPAERAAALARFAEDVRALCDYASARSTTQELHITLENFDRDVEKKRLLGPTVEAAAFAESVDRQNFGLTVDLSHLPLLRETPAQALRAAGQHLIHAHIGNCVIAHPESKLYGDFHPRFGHPEGANDLPEVIDFLRELKTNGFYMNARQRLDATPILSMEIRVSDESSETALANGKRVFGRAWASQ
jgi:sugar phosphate isomerase/epimerase